MDLASLRLQLITANLIRDSDGSGDAASNSELENEDTLQDDSSENEAPEAVARPYNALLKSLVPDTARGKPQRKKRRIEHEVDPATSERGQNYFRDAEPAVEGRDVDSVHEPEESAKQMPEENDEAAAIDQDEDGIFACPVAVRPY